MGCDLRPHNYLQHYDMLKDIWVSLAAMPTPRYAATSFLRGTKIYVLGKIYVELAWARGLCSHLHIEHRREPTCLEFPRSSEILQQLGARAMPPFVSLLRLQSWD